MDTFLTFRIFWVQEIFWRIQNNFWSQKKYLSKNVTSSWKHKKNNITSVLLVKRPHSGLSNFTFKCHGGQISGVGGVIEFHFLNRYFQRNFFFGNPYCLPLKDFLFRFSLKNRIWRNFFAPAARRQLISVLWVKGASTKL